MRKFTFEPFFPRSGIGAVCRINAQGLIEASGQPEVLRRGWIVAYRGSSDFSFKESIKLRVAGVQGTGLERWRLTKNYKPRHPQTTGVLSDLYWTKCSLDKALDRGNAWLMWQSSRVQDAPLQWWEITVPARHVIPSSLVVEIAAEEHVTHPVVTSGDYFLGLDCVIALTQCTVRLIDTAALLQTSPAVVYARFSDLALATRASLHPSYTSKYPLTHHNYQLEHSWCYATVLQQQGKYTKVERDRYGSVPSANVYLEEPVVGSALILKAAASPGQATVVTDEWIGWPVDDKLAFARFRQLSRQPEFQDWMADQEAVAAVKAAAEHETIDLTDRLLALVGSAQAQGLSHIVSGPAITADLAVSAGYSEIQQTVIEPLETIRLLS